MKLQKLIIHNIASIEDAEIDFRLPPLAASDVFLISGKTGSGKTTLLDAICLALFSSTPRIPARASGDKADDRDGADPLSTHPGQILRRNTGEGFVKLSFEGNDGRDYTAEWSIRRARKKIEGKLQGREWRLFEHGNSVPLDKVDDIKKKIEEVVGLDFSQFCRTTMLAQGDFSKFLNSKEDEKSQILEKITGSEIYASISKRIFEFTSARKGVWEKARMALEGISLLSPQQTDQINSEIAKSETDYVRLKAELEKQRVVENWMKSLSSLEKDCSKAQETLQKATDRMEDESFRADLKLIEDWSRSTDARNWIIAVRKAGEQLQQLEKTSHAIRDEYVDFLKGVAFVEDRKASLLSAIRTKKEFIDSRKGRRKSFENSQALQGALGSLIAARNVIAGENEKIEKEQHKLEKELVPNLAASENSYRKLLDEATVMEKDLKEKEKDLEGCDLPRFNRLRRDLTEKKGLIELTRKSFMSYLEKKSALERRLADFEKKKAELKKLDEELEALTPIIGQARLDEEKKREIYDARKDTVDKFAKAMRARLHIGDDCPVCRRKITDAFEPETELKALVDGYEKAWKEAEESLKAFVDRKNRLMAQKEADQAVVLRESEGIAEESKSLKKAETEVVRGCQSLGLGGFNGHTRDNLDKALKECLEELGDTERNIKKGEEKEAALKTLAKSCRKVREKTEEALKALTAVKEAIANVEAIVKASRSVVGAKMADLDASRREILKWIDGEWGIDWEEDPVAFVNVLIKETEEYNEALKELQNLELSLDKTKAILDSALQAREKILLLMPSWSTLEEKAGKRVADIGDAGVRIIAGLTSCINEKSRLEKDMNEKEILVEEFLHANDGLDRRRLSSLAEIGHEEMRKVEEKVLGIRNSRLAALTAFENAERRLKMHRLSKPEFPDEDTLDVISVRLEELSQSLKCVGELTGSLKRRLEEDAANRAKLKEALADEEAKKAEYDRWQRLNERLGSHDGAKFRRIAQSYILKSLVNSANHYMATLSGRYRLRSVPNSFVISVEDAYQGGTARPVTTLSGGETFLASLALALALSDIGDRLGVNTLFIDEGFGTLSGEPLQNAVNTLRTLHGKTGRHVGIISHIEELQEKIPVQIRVEQDGHNACSSVRIVQL